ncbi:MAG: hypothetical protein ABUS51_03280 [Acidobacteriota bacterium]
MHQTLFHGRRAFRIENGQIRVTILAEGGHIAEILEKSTGVNPLWLPPWPSIEVSAWSAEKCPLYGNDSESKLLAGIMGQNLCLDIFGPPSEAEARAGIVAHGEAGVAPYDFEAVPEGLRCRCILPASQLAFERTVTLDGPRARIHETVENLAPLDRPIAWTQHVTLGPPFLERGRTQFRASATRSRAIGETADFDWPYYGDRDLRIYPAEASSAGYTAHLMDPGSPEAFFLAWSPTARVVTGYVWKREDFPWLGIWEENNSRAHTPWLGHTQTRGMEFGVSPFPEPRRKMIERGTLFGAPAYRWIPARAKLTAEYHAMVAPADALPETLNSLHSV